MTYPALKTNLLFLPLRFPELEYPGFSKALRTAAFAYPSSRCVDRDCSTRPQHLGGKPETTKPMRPALNGGLCCVRVSLCLSVPISEMSIPLFPLSKASRKIKLHYTHKALRTSMQNADQSHPVLTMITVPVTMSKGLISTAAWHCVF